jgi:hypothetical protein
MRTLALLNLAVCMLLYGMLLSGCFVARGSVVSCPGRVEYSKSDQAAALAELQAADRAQVRQPTVNRMLDDYHKMREAAKACRAP